MTETSSQQPTAETAAPAASNPAAAPAPAPAPAQNATADAGSAPAVSPAAEAPAADAEPAPAEDLLGAEPGEAPAADVPDNGALGAPEAYDFKDVQLPEGVTLDPHALEALSGVAKELNLSQTAASKIVQAVGPKIIESQRQQVEAAKRTWVKEVMSDPVLGGSNWKRIAPEVNRAYQELVPKSLQKIFQATGLNSHPDLVRMCYRFASRTAQDSVEGGRSSGQQTISAKQFYNRSNMNE